MEPVFLAGQSLPQGRPATLDYAWVWHGSSVGRKVLSVRWVLVWVTLTLPLHILQMSPHPLLMFGVREGLGCRVSFFHDPCPPLALGLGRALQPREGAISGWALPLADLSPSDTVTCPGIWPAASCPFEL